MSAFEYVRADDVIDAVEMVSAEPDASFLAGGTTRLDLLLKDAIIASRRVVDLTRLPLRDITRVDDTIHVGALATMEDLAAHRLVVERLPLVREALPRQRLDAAPQHGDDRRQPPPADVVPLFPRPQRRVLQQARARSRMRDEARPAKVQQ